jgi:hypothetical protein
VLLSVEHARGLRHESCSNPLELSRTNRRERWLGSGTLLVLRLSWAAVLISAHGCARTSSGVEVGGSATGLSDAGRSPDAGLAGAAKNETPAASACHTDLTQRLICDASKAASVPWGSFITVRPGSGPAPQPEGGTIVPGGYRLVSETLYGVPDPETGTQRVGDQVKRVLHIDCDVANELYQEPPGIGGGNNCHRLVARALHLLEVTGWIADEGPPIPDSRDHVAYTAKGDHLTLIFLWPYWDYARGAVLGSYTSVDEYVRISAGEMDASIPTDEVDAEKPTPAVPKGRDPRCPAKAPAMGDPCVPDLAPLECEYGGDAWKRCTTFAQCALDRDEAFHFRIDPASPCTAPNAPECPATFSDATALAAQLGDAGAPPLATSDAGAGADGLACNYSEGACGCMSGPSLSFPNRCFWTCRSGAALGAVDGGTPCPWPRPLAGDPCAAGLECNYDVPCGAGDSLGPSMVCPNGYWAQAGDVNFGCGP